LAIESPADGLLVYNTTDGKYYGYVPSAATWKDISFGTGTILNPSFICGNAFTDSRDNKSYNSVLIGTQCWMADNLAYLPSVVGPATGSETEGYYYVYGYDGTDVPTAKATANYQIYGVLYNWTASLSACPTGWHLPTDSEWSTLTGYLGNGVGGIMKESGTIHWNSPNVGASNASGFTGLPAGYSDYNVSNFVEIGTTTYWSCSTESSATTAIYRKLSYQNALMLSYTSSKSLGCSVRCLKDL
jgi:uncharacterized protein (TIGR02145 family)